MNEMTCFAISFASHEDKHFGSKYFSHFHVLQGLSIALLFLYRTICILYYPLTLHLYPSQETVCIFTFSKNII